MGFPTANLDLRQDLIMPGDGIYATFAYVEGRRYMAAASIGVRPTFGEKERVVEVYILDYNGDLYDSEIAVEFVRRLRDELRFESAEALVAQVNRDIEQARDILGQYPPA